MDTIQVKRSQSLFDIALQVYGDLEGVFQLVLEGGFNGVLDNVYAGDQLRVNPQDVHVRLRAFLAPHDIATLTTQDRASGIGWWRIHHDFIIS